MSPEYPLARVRTWRNTGQGTEGITGLAKLVAFDLLSFEPMAFPVSFKYESIRGPHISNFFPTISSKSESMFVIPLFGLLFALLTDLIQLLSMENFFLIIEVFQNVDPLSVALGRALKSSIELSFLSPANLVLRVLGLFGQRSVARRDFGELFHVPDFQDTPNKTHLKVLFYGVMACCVKGCKMLLS